MKRLMSLTMMVACAAFLFTSCGNKKKKDEAAKNETKVEAPAKEDTSSTKADQATNTINLTGNDQMKYNKTSFTVKAGEEITLTLKNIGELPPQAMSHDVVVLKPGSDYKAFGMAATKAGGGVENLSSDLKAKIIAHTKMLGAGETDTITFTLEEPGTYPFVCTFLGHYPTMNGTITAK